MFSTNQSVLVKRGKRALKFSGTCVLVALALHFPLHAQTEPGSQVVYYSQDESVASTVRLMEDKTPYYVTIHPFAAGWTSVVSLLPSSNLVLFYSKDSGQALVGEVKLDGTINTLTTTQLRPRLDPCRESPWRFCCSTTGSAAQP